MQKGRLIRIKLFPFVLILCERLIPRVYFSSNKKSLNKTYNMLCPLYIEKIRICSFRI